MRKHGPGTVNFGSLFAGIGGMDMGLERAGMTCKWQVEIDGYCRLVLAKHWSDVKRYEDVREVGSHNLERVDLICGGFPCQDISNAGKRAGIDGERSGLWSEFARIICELRPQYVLVENVAALLVRGMGRILGDLAACGYDAEWDCIPAAAVGAPHIRNRVFIVAARQRNTSNTANGRHGRWKQQPKGCQREDVAYAEFARLEVWSCFGSDARQKLTTTERNSCTGGGIWQSEPNVGRVANGVPNRIHRLRGLGNAVVPAVAEYIGRLIMEADHESMRKHGPGRHEDAQPARSIRGGV